MTWRARAQMAAATANAAAPAPVTPRGGADAPPTRVPSNEPIASAEAQQLAAQSQIVAVLKKQRKVVATAGTSLF